MSNIIELNDAATPEGEMQSLKQLTVMRSIAIRTLVTEEFKTKARTEITAELQLIRQQQEQLDAQAQQQQRNIEEAQKQGAEVGSAMQQLQQEYHMAHAQLAEAHVELESKLQDLDTMKNGSYLTTGKLESPVVLGVGDKIYNKLGNAEILVKDGIITAMLG